MTYARRSAYAARKGKPSRKDVAGIAHGVSHSLYEAITAADAEKSGNNPATPGNE